MKPVVILANNVEELGGAQVVVHSLAEIIRVNGHDCTLVGVTLLRSRMISETRKQLH